MPATVKQSTFVFKDFEPKWGTSKWNILSFEFSINSILIQLRNSVENSVEKDYLNDPSTNLFLQKAI